MTLYVTCFLFIWSVSFARDRDCLAPLISGQAEVRKCPTIRLIISLYRLHKMMTLSIDCLIKETIWPFLVFLLMYYYMFNSYSFEMPDNNRSYIKLLRSNWKLFYLLYWNYSLIFNPNFVNAGEILNTFTKLLFLGWL